MQSKLSKKQIIVISSTLFGMLFGAGNIIFPVHVGQLSGWNFFPAFIGFAIAGVGIPIFGIISMAYSKCQGLFSFSSKVSKKFAKFFSVLLYLTICPLFVLPRSASISYGSGLQNIIGQNFHQNNAFFIFSLLFFIVVAIFTFKPSGITTWIGKIINPAFLCFFGFLIIFALINPMANIFEIEPDQSFQTLPFFNGFLQGYGTMDVLAGLAFGIVIINIIKSYGIKSNKNITKSLILPGCLSGLLMMAIYGFCIIIGAQSCQVFEPSSNGSIALSQISNYFFGGFGDVILTIIVTLASLKTCIGVGTSCCQSFTKMFPKGPKYNIWVLIFLLTSFVISNFGLDAILDLAIPVLSFLYPLAIVLIILAFVAKPFNYDSIIYKFTILFTLLASIFDFISNLPLWLVEVCKLDFLVDLNINFIPFMDLGFAWIIPSIIGFVIGIIAYNLKMKKDLKRAV